MQRLIVERVLAHEVDIHRLVRTRRQIAGLGDELRLHRQQVAENARERYHDIDPGTSERLERHELGAGEAAIAIEARLGPEKRERLSERAAFRLDVVRAPQHHRDRFRKRVAVSLVAGENARRLFAPLLHREGARKSAGIEAVNVSSGRQDRGRAQQIAAHHRPNEPPVERAQEPVDLVFLRQEAVDILQRDDGRTGLRIATPAHDIERRIDRCTVDERLEASIRALEAMIGLRHGGEKLEPFLAAGRRARDMQPMRDQRIFELEHGTLQIEDLLLRVVTRGWFGGG